MNQKMSAAKTAIVLDQPFFGALVCNLNFKEDPTCKTAWTDGTNLGFNPAYIDTLQHAEIVGLLCHEVLHCAGGHPWRREGRERRKFNVACDKAINPVVKEAGLALPKDSLESTPDEMGKSAEWIYDRLPDMPEDENGEGESDVPGEVRDSPSGNGDGDGQGDTQGNSSAVHTMSEGEWSEITRQAAVQAKAQGNLPASLDKFAKAAAQAKLDWKSILRKFVQESAKADYTWSRPASRFPGLYMPRLQSERVGKIGIGWDTSGSEMDPVSQGKIEAEVKAVIQEANPTCVEVAYCDTRVARVETFEDGADLTFNPCGGGGTDFRPVFDHFENSDEKPVCIIYITDMYGSFPESCEIPTMWVTDTENVEGPFGETLRIN